jgi:hypothetical protein
MSIKLVTPLQPLHVVDGAAFGTFTTFQDISPQPLLLIPQQSLEVGLTVDIEAWGQFSTTGTPTLSIGVWFNTVATVLAQSSAITTGTTAAAWPWHIKYMGRLRAVASGATGGSWNGQGFLDLGTALTTMATTVPMPITAAARTVSCDVTAARAIGVGAAWGTSSASNTITVNMLSVKLLSGL